MKMSARLALATVGSLLVSGLLALCVGHVLSRVAVADFDRTPELIARIHAEELAYAETVSLKFAVVLVPLTLLAVWLTGRRRLG
jgi:hypothetical protein